MVMTVNPLHRDGLRVHIIILIRQANIVEMICHLLERIIRLERFIAKSDI